MTDSLLVPPGEHPVSLPWPGPAEAVRGGGVGVVVVGVDDGPLPWGLLRHTLLVAARRRAPLRIVHVHGPETPPAAWYDDAAVRAQEHLAGSASIPVSHRCVTGDRVAALAAAAEPGGLLVLADRHRRLGSAAGSTLDAVIEVAPCPVLVVGECSAPPPPDGGVVAGVDGSADAAIVLRHALVAAAELATGVRAISTWAAPDRGPAAGLDALVAAGNRAFPQVPITLEQAQDRAGRRLIAAGREAALLVLGHRHAAPAGLADRGSTARTVLAAPPCPVVVLGPRVLDAAAAPPAGAGTGGPQVPGPP